jgi:succinate dehydrogenase/fumarate reductase cytochrome b subunit (b558 family)
VKESILPVSPVPPRIQAPERPRREVAINQIAALWDSMIGKKVVMAITGAVLVLFVIMHMIGNLKILSGPDNINAYAVFLREVGRPELGYGQLLWIVRIILLICVILHVTAVIQLTRMNQVACERQLLLRRCVVVVSCCWHSLSFTSCTSPQEPWDSGQVNSSILPFTRM